MIFYYLKDEKISTAVMNYMNTEEWGMNNEWL